MISPNQNQNEADKRRALVIAFVFLVAIVANLAMSLSLGAKSGDWQQYTRAEVVIVFGVIDVIAIIQIQRGKIHTGMWLIIGGIIFTLLGTVLLLAGFGLILAAIELALVITVAFTTLPDKERRWALLLAVGFAAIIYGVDFLPLTYRLSAPSSMSTALPIIATGIILAVAIFIISTNWKIILQFLQSSIRNRLTAIVIGAALIPVLLVSIILGLATYIQVRNSLTQAAFNELQAVQTIKANQVESYLDERRGDMITLRDATAALKQEAVAKLKAVNDLKNHELVMAFQNWDADVRDVASDPDIVTGLRALEAGYREIGSAQARSLYLGKSDLQNAEDGSLYSSTHLEQHSFFRGYISIHGYEDAFLIDANGNVVYSTQKTDLFGTNLVSGAYKDSSLAGLYQTVSKTPANQSVVADTAILLDKYVMFIGAPVYDQNTFIGVLVYQLPLTLINQVAQNRTGLTASSESYVIGKTADGEIQLRSNRVVKEGAIGDPKPGVDSENALAGQSGADLRVGSTGVYEISVYSPLEIPGLNWAIATTSAVSEVFVPTLTGHEKDFLTELGENYGFHDVFLISPDGYIFYSANKKPDFQTNILTGPYKDTNLGALVSEINSSKSFEFVDFATYAPSAGAPAAFFGIPLLNENNAVDMIVVTQASQEQIGKIMAETTGLGETGETFLIGQDKLRRTETRFIGQLGVESTILNPKFPVDTVASRSALAGGSGQATITDNRGESVMVVWSPIHFVEAEQSRAESQAWALIAKVNETEALAPVNRLAGTLALVIGLGVLVIGAAAVFIGARFAINFVQPILALTDTAAQVAAGNMNLQVASESKDELGTLSNAFNTMTAQVRDSIVNLEERVQARTKDLATVAQISTQTSTIQDPYQMLQTAVHLTQRGFNLYHAHVFTYHPEDDELHIVACGYKEGDEHEGTHGTTSIPLQREQSLVARAGRTRKPVIVNDVRSDAGWLPNPLLPETRAELAVPMIVGDELLGVLDVQSERVDAFTEEDANIQMTLAAQIATALKNAQSYSDAKARADLETLVNTIGQKIQRAGTVEDTLQIAVRELGAALGAARVQANIETLRENTGDGQN